MPTDPLSLSSAQQATSAIPAVVSTDDGDGERIIKRGRLKTPMDLATSYQGLFNEDLESSRQRAKVDAAVGGAAPYDYAKERKLNLHGRSNINFGTMGETVSEAQKPFFRFLDSIDTLCTTPLLPDYLEPEIRLQYEQIISEEVSTMVKNWPSFLPRWGQLTLLYVLDELGFTLFTDNIDWRWQVRGLQHLKFPRDVEVDVDNLDIVTCTVQMRPDELLKKINSEKNLPPTEKRYWNEAAITQAVKDTARSWSRNTNNPEEVVEAWKNNDISWGLTACTVPVIHGFVRETDGTVSHYIGRYDGDGEFLYKCEGKFSDISQLMTAFIGNVGTNGDFHSIRGLGYKLFTPTTGYNRLLNKFLDQAITAATPHLLTDSEDNNVEQAITPMGPYNIMAKGTSFAETQSPDFSQNLIPALGMMTDLIRSRGASSAPVSSNQLSRTQKTKYQVQTETEEEGMLRASGFSLFMACWQRHLRCVVKRICRKDYQITDPGGKEVWAMRRRLVRRGVPLDALQHVDFEMIEANSGLGKGSAAERRTIVDALSERLGPYLDQKGQQLLHRWTASAYAGTQIAKLLVPDQPGLRPPVDVQIAQMESNQMAQGQPPSFAVNQDHVVHVNEHLNRLMEINGALTQLQIELRPAIDQMQPIWEHCINDHMPLISPQNPAYKPYKEALQQLGEVINNSRKHLDAEEQREAKAAGENPEELYGGTPAGIFAASVDASARLATLNKDEAQAEQIRAKTQIELERHQQETAIRDVDTAVKVRDSATRAQQAAQKKSTGKN